MKTSDIKMNSRNPRKITSEALEKLKESIQRDPEFMKLRPIVVDENMMVLGGNQRLAAIKKLGMKDVPDEWVVQAAELSEEQRKRFILVDNNIPGMSGEFDLDILVDDWELSELEDLGFDLDGIEVGDIDVGDVVGGEAGKSLSGRFGVPPFSVLNAREGWWQNRKRAWVAIGIKSEFGRGSDTPDSGVTDKEARTYQGG